MDNNNGQRARKRVSRKVLRRRQLAALAVIAFLVLLFVVLVAKGCSKSGEGGSGKAEETTTTTTGTAIVTEAVTTTTEPVTTTNAQAAKVQLSTRELFLDIGETDVPIIQSYPDDETGESDEVWTSMDSSIAVVNNTGYITGVSKGETFIILSFKNHPDIEIEIKVHVADDGSSSTPESSETGDTTEADGDNGTADAGGDPATVSHSAPADGFLTSGEENDA